MKILIIGGTGFIGQHLFRSLARDHQVFLFARHARPSSSNHKREEPSFILGDVTQSYSINNACAGIDCIVYLASTVIPATSNLDPIFDIQTNLIGAVNTLNAAINNGVRRFVFLSSGGTIYGSEIVGRFKESDPEMPLCSYGIVKLATEKYIQMYNKLHGLSYSVLRLSNPYGPGYRLDKPQGAVGFFINSILGDKTIEVWGDGSVERDFIFIDDAVEAISSAVLSEEEALLLNVGSGVSTSINELINIIGSETGKNPKVRLMPARPFDVKKSILDIAAAKTSLDWTPKTDLRTGIRMTLQRMLR